LLKKRFDVYQAFLNFQAHVERKFSRKIITTQINWDGEYETLNGLFKKVGITITFFVHILINKIALLSANIVIFIFLICLLARWSILIIYVHATNESLLFAVLIMCFWAIVPITRDLHVYRISPVMFISLKMLYWMKISFRLPLYAQILAEYLWHQSTSIPIRWDSKRKVM
jgi:hypothetical protein